eukprot:GFYU01008546.1.p1 GENE.GFYU01008546.1~~GFYU01008546.1.p1  ORF type:complete len:480 (-),score=180.97 GFYU01008546.1:142-1512(-)
MSSFAPATKKRKDANGAATKTGEYFAGIPKIKFDPKSKDMLVFKHYNPDEVVEGRKMKDWLRFSVVYWHTFRGTGADPFGFPTIHRHFDDGSDSVENALNRLRAAFELFQKLGVDYWTFHDRDIAPEVDGDIKKTNEILDKVVDLAEELQKETGVKLLWGTSNLFANPRYMNGGFTNPDAHVFAYAAAQVKKAMEVTHRLGGENFVFWGGREGYQSMLNTNVKRELDHAAAFFKMAVEHKKKIGATFQFLLEPKPREPTKHQYDYDAQTCIAFLKTYGLDNDFKLNIEPNHTTLAGHEFEHDVMISSEFGFLGSIDSNTGDTLLGWDTDQFPTNVRQTTRIMQIVMNQGGLAPGGLNFDCKVRRESTDPEDFFLAHIGAMDAFARGLKAAAAIKKDGRLDKFVKDRYSTFDKDIGKKVENGSTSFEELAKYAEKHGDPSLKSGKQEWCENVFNDFM